jgi:phosphoglycolate phosphatase
MHIEGYSKEILQKFIGPPLQWGFSNLFGMNEKNTALAVEHFRHYFGEKGLFENEPYSGILEMLEKLDIEGKKLYIATSKLEKYALRISEHFGFDKYIIALQGAGYDEKHASKTGILNSLLENNQIVTSKKVVMVGDTVFDIEAGKQAGLSTIAVTYGFGTKTELKKSQPDYIIDSVDDLYELLSS